MLNPANRANTPSSVSSRQVSLETNPASNTASNTPTHNEQNRLSANRIAQNHRRYTSYLLQEHYDRHYSSLWSDVNFAHRVKSAYPIPGELKGRYSSAVKGITVEPISQFRSFEKNSLSNGLIDSSKPTILLFDNHNNDSAEQFLYAKAAQISRQRKATGSINVVIATDTNPGSFTWAQDSTKDRWGLYLNRGIIVDAKGVIHYGNFPKPVQIDLVDNYNSSYPTALFEECKTRGIPLTRDLLSKEVIDQASKIFPNKTSFRKLQSVSNKLGFHIPESLTLSESDLRESRDLLQEKVRNFIEENPKNGLVLNPPTLSGAFGVKMLASPVDIDKCLELIKKSINEFGSITLQPWIESFPIYSDKSWLNRQDWNCSVTGTDRESDFSIQAKVNPWGKVVHESQGASLVDFGTIVEKLKGQKVAKDKIDALLKKLQGISTSVAKELEVGNLLVEFNFIIDKNLEPWLIGAGFAKNYFKNFKPDLFTDPDSLVFDSPGTDLELKKTETVPLTKNNIRPYDDYTKVDSAKDMEMLSNIFLLKKQRYNLNDFKEHANLLKELWIDDDNFDPATYERLAYELFELALISGSKNITGFALDKLKRIFAKKDPLEYKAHQIVANLFLDNAEVENFQELELNSTKQKKLIDNILIILGNLAGKLFRCPLQDKQKFTDTIKRFLVSLNLSKHILSPASSKENQIYTYCTKQLKLTLEMLSCASSVEVEEIFEEFGTNLDAQDSLIY